MLQRAVWETVPGVAFLSVADGSRVRFKSPLAGHFRVLSKPSLRTTVQVRLAVLARLAALVLHIFTCVSRQPHSRTHCGAPGRRSEGRRKGRSSSTLNTDAVTARQTMDGVEYNAAARSVTLSGASRQFDIGTLGLTHSHTFTLSHTQLSHTHTLSHT